jgi:hypothetical protein
MNDDLTNQLNMIGACITVADLEEHKDVWEGNEPSAFETDYGTLKTDYTAARALQAQVESAVGGTTDAKTNAEAALEELAFRMARALANYFTSIGDLANLGKVDIVKSDLVRLRHQALAARTTEIRDLANTVAALPAAIARGVTAAKVTALTTAIETFEGLRNAPRGAASNRAALRRELTTDIGTLMTSIRSLDDLVMQFPGEDGERFADAWKQARIIVDLGHGPGDDEEEDPTPTPPTPPTP